jgi:3-oxoacyl-[acyl-carrier-protein] synthase II
VNREAENPGEYDSGRSAVVTGVGFCLPGRTKPVFTAEEAWDVAANGQSCLEYDEVYYGSVKLTQEMFDEHFPDLPPFFSRHYTSAHRYGLVSLAQACEDADLNFRDGALSEAAILVGRGGIDANVDSYLSVLSADPASDVALVQGAVTRSNGPCYTVSCGCASSAVQIANARRMIASGEIDIAVVTGVDVFDMQLIQNIQRLLHGAQQTYDALRTPDMPELVPSFLSLMRPYDRRADCINHGEGSATLIIESREHATRRGAHIYGQVLNTAMTRDGLANPLACDDTGSELVSAVRRCLGDRWRIDDVPYVHGGSDGNIVVTTFESNAIRELYGDRRVLMTSQEGCFGHNGAPAGCVGVALTLMMMERGQVCPTANCEQPADGLPFDPVPGVRTRPLDFDYALTFNYQVGGVKNAMLLGSIDAV